LKAHERLVMLALVLAFGCHFTEKYFDYSAIKAHEQLTAANNALAQATQNYAQAQATAAQAMQRQQDSIDALVNQTNALAAAATQRQATLKTQVATDDTAALPALVDRWATLVPGAQFTAPVGDNITVSSATAHKTVDVLETVPVQAAQIADDKTQIASLDNVISAYATTENDQTRALTALQLKFDDAGKQCQADIKTVKDDARKSKVKWFKIGFVSGFFGGLFAGSHGL